MARRILDPALKAKLAKKLGRSEKSIGVSVSKMAHRLGVSSEAALIVLAKQHGIGTAIFQRKLDAAKQAEVRGALPNMFAQSGQSQGGGSSKTAKAGGRMPAPSKKASLRAAVEYLIEDPVLLSRCRDLLLASANFDRAVNQATQVLEDRIRNKAEPPNGLVGENLVGYAFKEDITNTVLRVASNDPGDQRGFTQILKGLSRHFGTRRTTISSKTFRVKRQCEYAASSTFCCALSTTPQR